jgi:hypothetical protein
MVQQQDSSDPTGVSSDRDTRVPTIRARERKANAALQLALAGADPTTIAEACGYPSARAARVAIERALEKQLERDPTNKAKMRMLASRRLERLLTSVWAKANDPDHPEHLLANTKARELVAQWTKLHGLDAPAEVVVHSPTTDMLEDWVSRVLTQAAPQVTEHDFLDIPAEDIKELEEGTG